MKTVSSSLLDIYESEPNSSEPENNICQGETPRSRIVRDSDVAYTEIGNPLKDIFHATSAISSKLEKTTRKDDIEVFLHCFQEIFYDMCESFIGTLKMIELIEDDDGIDVVWRYRDSIVYFSFSNNSSLVNYGAIIDSSKNREREVLTGTIEPTIEARTIEYKKVLNCQLLKISKG